MSRLPGLRASVLLLCSLGLVILSTRAGSSSHIADEEQPSLTVQQFLSTELKGKIQAGFAPLFKPETAATAPLIISEFRLRGPNGANDEFIEIYNNSDSNHTVSAPAGSTGYAVACSSFLTLNDASPSIKFVIPNGTVIPARGHFLGANSTGYSLAAYPAGDGTTATADATFTLNTPDNAGIALFETSVLANFTLANRIDAVGSDAETNAIYKEGVGYPALLGLSVDSTLYRKLPGGCSGSIFGNCTSVTLITTTLGPSSSYPQDTGDNATDFVPADTNGLVLAPNIQRLGVPGPENLSGPIAGILSPGLVVSRLDSSVSEDSAPNRFRDTTPGNSSNSSFGTFSFRRRFTNNLGQPITRLRFRVVDLTTFPALGSNCNTEPPPATCVADLRPITSVQTTVTVNDATTCAPLAAPCSAVVQGTNLETPPLQPTGGGYNSSWSAGTVTVGTPLLNGASINLQFLTGVQQTGVGRLFVLVEALPRSGPATIAVVRLGGPPFSGTTDTVQFSTANFSVAEDVAEATIRVNRSGSTNTAATVDYATSDGTALQKSDYTVARGTLKFAAGETSKTFGVLISEDAYVEGSETLNITLSNPTGGLSLGTPNTATLTITDDDTVNPPVVNPIDDARTFVRQHYHDFLAREGDQGGIDYWTNLIQECGTDQLCVRARRIAVSDAFFFEPEFQQTGSYVLRLYRAAYGNNQPFPNPDITNVTEARKIPSYAVFGQDRGRLIAGAGLAQSQLELANLFVLRQEFLTKYPASLGGSAFVDALLATITNDLGVDLTAQRAELIALFNLGGRGNVIYRLADDNAQTNPINNRTFIDEEYNRSFVTIEFFGYLRRDADIGGFLFWLGQVNRFPVRNIDIQHAMVCSFITSTEYQERFSSVVTHTNGECPQ